MGKLTILLKICMAAIGLVMAGFGLLCFITTYLSAQYGGGVASGITVEFTNWGLAFMLNAWVQAFFIFGGGFLFILMCWSIIKDFEKCSR